MKQLNQYKYVIRDSLRSLRSTLGLRKSVFTPVRNIENSSLSAHQKPEPLAHTAKTSTVAELRGILDASRKLKTEDYVYNDDDQAISDWMKNFTSRQGDGGGDPEEAYLQIIEVMAACSRTNWLEIGCGFGRLVPIISRHAASYVGIEPDFHRFQECATRHHAPENGIEILNFNSLDYHTKNPEKRYGAIIVSMVIQHVPTFVCKGILSDVHGLLDTHGVAIIATTQTPIDLYTRQHDSTPISMPDYDVYASNPKDADLGLPVRKFSKETFLREIEEAGFEIVAWNQFSYIRPHQANWFAEQYGVTTESVENVADSQYAIVKKRKSA